MDAFTDLAIILVLAATVSVILTKIKQPAILGYIFTGLIVGAILPELRQNVESLEVLAKVGVALLLFILGLNLDLGELKRMGKVAVATGIGQIVFTGTIGVLISLALGFNLGTSLYLAIGLAFSSTIVIVKLLSQGKQLDTIFGRISVGFLIVQDFIAILILVVLSVSQAAGGQADTNYLATLALVILKGLVVILAVWLFNKIILGRVLDSLKDEAELLFVVVLAWAFALAAIMASPLIGFSIEIGALIAGISLANRFESLQIESWAKPLRDFFIILFFVLLGLHIDLAAIGTVLPTAILFSAFVLIGNPIIVMLIMRALGYSAKTGFLTSLAVAQISEFSLIIVQFGLDAGQLTREVLTLMTLVGGITMTISAYMIRYNMQLYRLFKPVLGIFEPRKLNEMEIVLEDFAPRFVLFGAHRMGRRILNNVASQKDKFLIVDLDPNAIRELRNLGYTAVFGDISDHKMYEGYKLDKAEVVISTVPDTNENLKLIAFVKSLENKPTLIIAANNDLQATRYYQAGADIVVYPHLLAGDLVRTILMTELSIQEAIKRHKEYMQGLLG